MNDLLFVPIGLLSLLWVTSILLSKNWIRFSKFALINSILTLVYLLIINLTNWIDIGHDEYGLRIIILNFALIVSHLLLGLVACIFIKCKIKKEHQKV